MFTMLDATLVVLMVLASLKFGYNYGLKDAQFDQERANIKLQQCQDVIAWKDRK